MKNMLQKYLTLLIPISLILLGAVVIALSTAYVPVFRDSNGQFKLVLWHPDWNVGPFYRGMASFANRDGKFGYVDKFGVVRIQPVFDGAKPFFADIASVVKDSRESWIDKSGKATVRLKPGLRSSENNLAQHLILAKYIDASSEFDGYCFLGKDGQVRIEGPFQSASGFSQGVASVDSNPIGELRNPKFYFIDESGQKVSGEFWSLDSIKEGLAAASVVDRKGNRLFGFVDKLGRFVIKPTYLSARAFQEGLAPVKSSSGWGFINKSNQFIIRPQYLDAHSFAGGLAAVAIGSKEKAALFPNNNDPFALYGFIDRQGSWVIEPRFFRTGDFTFGFAEVAKLVSASPEEEALSAIDKSGTLIFPFTENCDISLGGGSLDWYAQTNKKELA